LQCLPRCFCLPHFRLLAELHSLRRPRMGPPPPRRYSPRHSILAEGLDPPGAQHSTGHWKSWWIQRCLEEDKDSVGFQGRRRGVAWGCLQLQAGLFWDGRNGATIFLLCGGLGGRSGWIHKSHRICTPESASCHCSLAIVSHLELIFLDLLPSSGVYCILVRLGLSNMIQPAFISR
jgi:hypothetical protein